MRKFLLLAAFMLLLHSCGSTSRIGRTDRQWSYEAESAGVGTDGTYSIRVWSYSNRPDLPVETAKRNAVHAVIFRGIPAGHSAAAQPPLVTEKLTPEDSLFFDNFFISDYQRFISSTAAGSVQTIQTGRREYKTGYTISVAKDNLRRYLEDSGIIRSLSSGF